MDIAATTANRIKAMMKASKEDVPKLAPAPPAAGASILGASLSADPTTVSSWSGWKNTQQ